MVTSPFVPLDRRRQKDKYSCKGFLPCLMVRILTYKETEFKSKGFARMLIHFIILNKRIPSEMVIISNGYHN
jgi:hypothetical protein